MKVTYIHHSSFLVELERAVLLFDYYQGEIGEIPKQKSLFVFASHGHGDHFSKKIFEIAERHSDVTYILSDDIQKKEVPQNCLGQTHFIGPGEHLTLGEVQVETLKSTDAGVAFWISLEGKNIYHAGDLHHWFWKGEEEAWNREMTRNYRNEIQKLKGRHADLAFLVLDPRQEEAFFWGLDDFTQVVSADLIVPMHFWGDYSVIQKLKAMDCAEKYRDKIQEIHREGEIFQWSSKEK